MRASFVSFVRNRHLLADLAYAMLDRGQIGAASEAEVRSVVSTLLADPDKLYGFDTVDEFLQRAYATELLFPKEGVVQWRSVKSQAYLAALVLYAEYCQRGADDEQEAATWLQVKAELTQWHEPISVMGHYIKEVEHARQIAELLTAALPLLAAQYKERLGEGFFETLWSERMFLGEVAWPLGDVPFWKEALGDRDPDTRRQAALVLGIARAAEAEGLLLDRLNDEDDQVRAMAAWAIGRLAAIDAVKYLTPLLDDVSQRVRFQVRRALSLGKGKPNSQFPVAKVERAGKRILVSDDDLQMLDMYRVIWENAGYQVMCAPGGEQTLKLVQRERPDLITTDIMNTHMMGTDLVLELRNETATREIPIVLVTAQPLFWFSGSWPWLCVFEGADAYLQKPFDVKELVTIVDEMLFC